MKWLTNIYKKTEDSNETNDRGSFVPMCEESIATVIVVLDDAFV